MESNKIVIFCAPSGAGKTTVAQGVIKRISQLSFSISATNREKRDYEKEGVDYYFLKKEDFRNKIRMGEFLEWEEVYEGIFYGTLKLEVSRIQNLGQIPVFDIDVKGAMNLKKRYVDLALIIFIKTPVEEIKKRLEKRNTENERTFEMRLDRIKEEMIYEERADVVIENIDLEKAINEAEETVKKFIL
ncbi:MAG: guanylate kinase [Patescibacteria group bacterium]|nr:guanylate kinase [Patescibacteria group bacterium]